MLEKMENSDGIILATPNYAFQVSARMKNLLDRLAYVYHRPRFFGKTCTAIVVQGMLGGGDILKYLHTAGANLGFTVSKGCCITALDPMTERQDKELSRKIERASARFYEQLRRPTPSPSFFRLMMFRMARTSIKTLDDSYRDYQYYKEKGWLDSDYYYATSLNPMKRLAGGVFDIIGRQVVKRQ